MKTWKVIGGLAGLGVVTYVALPRILNRVPTSSGNPAVPAGEVASNGAQAERARTRKEVEGFRKAPTGRPGPDDVSTAGNGVTEERNERATTERG